MAGKEKMQFVSAFGAGIIAALLFVSFYAGEQVTALANYFVVTGKRIQELSLDYSEFWKIVLRTRGKEFLFLFLLSMFRFGKGVQMLYCTYLSFSQIVILMGLTCAIGWQGIFVWIAYAMPQIFLYGFAIYYIVRQRESLQRILYQKHPMAQWFLALGVYLVCVLAGVLLETFANPQILNWVWDKI